MEIKPKIALHNKFDIEVIDTKTGELKQKAIAYNVVTDVFFKARMNIINSSWGHPISTDMGLILVGKGTGTPAITDTALFDQAISKASEITEEVYAYPTSHVSRRIKIETTECNDETLTEVGIAMSYRAGAYDYPTLLLSHAMIQDAEGSTIAIQKTDTDVVYITATFYCTFVSSGFGNNGIYPDPSENILVKWLLRGQYSLSLRSNRYALTESSELITKYHFAKTYEFADGTGNLTNLTFTLPVFTILDSEWNNSLTGVFGFPGIGAFVLPDSSVFPDRAIDHIAIGTGDGETTEFNIKAPLIKSGTARVFVDSVELASTDFSVDYESNCCDAYENYHSASLAGLDSTQVVFGDFAEQSGTSTVYDPMAFGYKDGWKQTNKPATATINAAHPVWIDFGSAKECNRLKITRNSPPAMTIEYSSDNTAWTAVTATETSGVYTFDVVSARYWRIYPTSGNWTPSLTGSATLDSVNTGAFVFLGKTTPGLTINSAPALGAVIQASYSLSVPFKTENNLLRMSCTIQLQRG